MNKIKLRVLIISIALILSTYFSQETLAYYTVGGVADSVVTSGGVKLQIHEETADGTAFPKNGIYVEPGDVVSKRVSIENVSTQPFYLRVKIISGVEQTAMAGEELFNININTADWTRHEDGYIYYNSVLQPGERSTPVFTEVGIAGQEKFRGETLTLTVTAHATQSKNNTAEHPWDAAGWPED